jgi:hypothetical protein
MAIHLPQTVIASKVVYFICTRNVFIYGIKYTLETKVLRDIVVLARLESALKNCFKSTRSNVLVIWSCKGSNMRKSSVLPD